jgi:hypothetical protein
MAGVVANMCSDLLSRWTPVYRAPSNGCVFFFAWRPDNQMVVQMVVRDCRGCVRRVPTPKAKTRRATLSGGSVYVKLFPAGLVATAGPCLGLF